MKVTECRMCKSTNLEEYINLGHQPPSDAFLTKEQTKEAITHYPLNVVLCKDCGLSQLGYVVPPEILYQQEYPYESSTTEKGRKHYWDFADSVSAIANVMEGELVIDIGSNVGVLLEGFKNNGAKVLGIDPAPNIVKKANDRGIETICEFFSSDVAENVVKKYGEASVITGTNVFAHVNDLFDFMRGVYTLLEERGVFVFESPSLLELVKNNAYSSIYHEHLSYLSLKPVVKFAKRMGLEVVRVEKHDIHEGSFRVFITKSLDWPIDKSVNEYLEEEEKSGIHNIATLKEFGYRAYEHLRTLDKLVRKLKGEKRDGESSIVLLSAPAKGMTIVNSLGWDYKLIEYATEKTPLKVGKFLPGGSIPVVEDKALLQSEPDYALIMAWNFQDEIIKNNMEYLKNGGKFIQLFPWIQVITKEMYEAKQA